MKRPREMILKTFLHRLKMKALKKESAWVKLKLN
jgi:hypothetical protein